MNVLMQRKIIWDWPNEILIDAGKISAEQANLHAETEFEKYRIVQDRMFMSDYDKFLLELEEQTKNKNRV